MKNLELGLTGKFETKVVLENTAAACDRSLPEVFSTPKLLESIEAACIDAISACYEDGELTVGLSADFTHMAASPIGFTVRAESKLIDIKGGILTFEVSAFDDKEQVASGTHKRAVINREKFNHNLEKKLQK